MKCLTAGVAMTVYRTCVYIDGFNFYHSIKNKIYEGKIIPEPNLRAACEKKLVSFPTQKHGFAKINIEKIDLIKVYYFTAKVKMTDDALQKPSRQDEICNYAVIISNGTDFCGAIKFVREKFTAERENIVDAWKAGMEPTCKELRDVASICHNLTDNEFKKIPQIANRNFNPLSGKNNP